MRIGLSVNTRENSQCITNVLATLQSSIREVIIIMTIIDLSLERFGAIPWEDFDRVLRGHRNLRKLTIVIYDKWDTEVGKEIQEQLRDAVRSRVQLDALDVSFT